MQLFLVCKRTVQDIGKEGQKAMQMYSRNLFCMSSCAVLSLGVFAFASLSAKAQGGATLNQLKGSIEIDVSETGANTILFGAAYDSRRRVFLGGSCVTFTSEDVWVQPDEPQMETNYLLTSSKSDIARQLDLSVAVSARYGTRSFGAYADAKTDVLKKTTASRLSRSMLVSASAPKPYRFINLDSSEVGLQSARLEMAQSQRGQFRRDCGDAFVIGMQTGHRFYGLADFSESAEEKLDGLNIEANAGYRGAGAQAEAAVERLLRESEEFSSQEVLAKTWQTGPGYAVTDMASMEGAFTNFVNNVENFEGSGELLKLMVVSYDALNNYPVRNPLAPRTNEDALESLTDALWDLQSMRQEIETYLDPANIGGKKSGDRPPRYGYGDGLVLVKLGQLRDRYAEELEAIRDLTLSCLENFTPACGEAAALYSRDPVKGSRIKEWDKELSWAPVPLAAICRDIDFSIDSDLLNDGFRRHVKSLRQTSGTGKQYYPQSGNPGESTPILVAHEHYDCDPDKPGLNCDRNLGDTTPVKIRTWLNFSVSPGATEAIAFLGANFSEHKLNESGFRVPHSEVGGFSRFRVFPPTKDQNQRSSTSFPPSCVIESIGDPSIVNDIVQLKEPAPGRIEIYGMRPPGMNGSHISGGLSNHMQMRNSTAYGYIEGYSPQRSADRPVALSRSESGYAKNRGMLRSVQCIGNTRGDDVHIDGVGAMKESGASCLSLRVDTIPVRLMPKEDIEMNTRFISKIAKTRLTPLKITSLKEKVLSANTEATSPRISTGVIDYGIYAPYNNGKFIQLDPDVPAE